MYLTITDECERGDHSLCKIHSEIPKNENGKDMIICGGWVCTCNCHKNLDNDNKKQ